MDYICHLVEGGIEEKAVFEFASDPGGSPNSSLSVYASSPFDLPESYSFSDINDAASYRPLKCYDDALLVSFDDGSGGSEVYQSTSQINFQGGDDICISLNENNNYIDSLSSDESPLLAAARVYNVRQPYRVPLAFNPEEDYPSQFVLLNGDIPVESSWDDFADQHVALDTMFVYGIDGTSRSNCLIHNLRCEGRRQDGNLTFYPSSDTLLYLMTTSLVHGCRGIHLRALNMTMMCGNGGGSAPSGTYRSPPLLLNWGPGVETTNPDMLGRLYSVVRSLTGKNTSDPDFMSALIDEDYAILDTADVRNAIQNGVWHQDTDNDYLNFIALEETESEDVLLLVVNDTSEMLFEVNWVAGFECIANDSRNETKLRLDFEMMPAYTASLYWFEYTGD
jgi:hypothetical protein